MDPRVQNELEELNAATDGINHLETELSEAQLLFDQTVEDSKVCSNLNSQNSDNIVGHVGSNSLIMPSLSFRLS